MIFDDILQIQSYEKLKIKVITFGSAAFSYTVVQPPFDI